MQKPSRIGWLTSLNFVLDEGLLPVQKRDPAGDVLSLGYIDGSEVGDGETPVRVGLKTGDGCRLPDILIRSGPGIDDERG